MQKVKKIILLLIILIIAFDMGKRYYQNVQYEKKYENLRIEIFVDERNAVFQLYEAIGLLISHSSDMNYETAYEVAVLTEDVCVQTYWKATDLVNTHANHLVYYSTFYRDVKKLLELKCSEEKLQKIYEILEKILMLYDGYSNPIETKEKIKEMDNFYYKLSRMQEEMNLYQLIE